MAKKEKSKTDQPSLKVGDKVKITGLEGDRAHLNGKEGWVIQLHGGMVGVDCHEGRAFTREKHGDLPSEGVHRGWHAPENVELVEAPSEADQAAPDDTEAK